MKNIATAPAIFADDMMQPLGLLDSVDVKNDRCPVCKCKNLDREDGFKICPRCKTNFKLFDDKAKVKNCGRGRSIYTGESFYWYNFTLYHSRFYAKRNERPISKLCVADKYAFCIPPKWLYMLLVNISGEIDEYMTTSRIRVGKNILTDKSAWYDYVYNYMQDWIKEHKDNLNDTWTKIK